MIRIRCGLSTVSSRGEVFEEGTENCGAGLREERHRDVFVFGPQMDQQLEDGGGGAIWSGLDSLLGCTRSSIKMWWGWVVAVLEIWSFGPSTRRGGVGGSACGCSDWGGCPLDSACSAEEVICRAEVGDDSGWCEVYVAYTEGTFKQRWYSMDLHLSCRVTGAVPFWPATCGS